jgi:hypothetical protein
MEVATVKTTYIDEAGPALLCALHDNPPDRTKKPKSTKQR